MICITTVIFTTIVFKIAMTVLEMITTSCKIVHAQVNYFPPETDSKTDT
jgi:5-bromo-4-chloroindolyl phosphate hydrolysis protein